MQVINGAAAVSDETYTQQLANDVFDAVRNYYEVPEGWTLSDESPKPVDELPTNVGVMEI